MQVIVDWAGIDDEFKPHTPLHVLVATNRMIRTYTDREFIREV